MDTMELDRLIERAARGTSSRDAANERAAMWAVSTRRHREKLRAEHRELWLEYHRGQIVRLRRTMELLIARHERSVRLLEGKS